MSDRPAKDVRRVSGFVDAHSHDDLAVLRDPARAVKRRQGIVHQVIGNCGLTPFPLEAGERPEYERFLFSVLGSPGDGPGLFEHTGDYMAMAPSNVTVLLGYNSIRERMFGEPVRPHIGRVDNERPLNESERRRVCSGVNAALEAGARGVSIGLSYRPALYADREELAALAAVTPLLTVHMRNESGGVLDSLDEIAGAVATARHRGAACRLHISHLKIAGQKHWPLLERLHVRMAHWHEAIGITFDHYPFPFGSTGLAALLPPEFSALTLDELRVANPRAIEDRMGDTDWENYVDFAGLEGLVLTELVTNPELNGRNLVGQPLGELLRDLVISEPHPAVLIHGQSDAVIDEFLRLPYGCIGSDALPDVTAHPRLTRTFPEYLVRMKRLGQPFDFTIRKASDLPREIFGIRNDETVLVDAEEFRLVEDGSALPGS